MAIYRLYRLKCFSINACMLLFSSFFFSFLIFKTTVVTTAEIVARTISGKSCVQPSLC